MEYPLLNLMYACRLEKRFFTSMTLSYSFVDFYVVDKVRVLEAKIAKHSSDMKKTEKDILCPSKLLERSIINDNIIFQLRKIGKKSCIPSQVKINCHKFSLTKKPISCFLPDFELSLIAKKTFKKCYVIFEV